MSAIRTVTLSLAVSLAPAFLPAAEAGGCFACDSSDDCGSGPFAFCVHWYRVPPPCGTVENCCSQGCAIDPNGRPDCESTGDCAVVENLRDAGVDASIIDAESVDVGFDSGSSSADATSANADAMTSDASLSETDASLLDAIVPEPSGVPRQRDDTSCSCDSGTRASSGTEALLLLLLIIALRSPSTTLV